MRTFKINDEHEAVCESQNTRSGFRHVAILIRNGCEIDRTKVCYQNRTWESYEFQTVLSRLLDNTKILSDEEKKLFLEKGERQEKERVETMFKTISAVAKIGELMTDNKKDCNDWKKRMIKAGLGEGVSFPEDWETLSEEEKEQRLNKSLEGAA